MSPKERFEKLLKERNMVDSAEEIVNVVSDFLDSEADTLKEEEPYATNSIRKYEDASYTVQCILSDIF